VKMTDDVVVLQLLQFFDNPVRIILPSGKQNIEMLENRKQNTETSSLKDIPKGLVSLFNALLHFFT
jgi:hypothetical protein